MTGRLSTVIVRDTAEELERHLNGVSEPYFLHEAMAAIDFCATCFSKLSPLFFRRSDVEGRG
jgi:hypothetical protein